MDKLIERVADKLDVDIDKAEHAVGTVLALLRKKASPEIIQELTDRVPGAGALADKYAAKKKSLFATLGGTTMAAFMQLSAAGLSTGQIEVLGQEVLKFSEEQLGKEKVAEIIESVPGLDKLI